MKKSEKKSRITDLMVLIVFCVFAVCVLMVLLTGAGLYRNLVRRGAEGYDRRTVCQYISTRVRQADMAASVSTEDFEGEDALVFREQIDGTAYLTRVYCYDGYIRELFTAESSSLSPEDGEQLAEAASLDCRLEGTTLSVEIGFQDGSSQTLTLYLRSGEGDAP